MLLPGWSCGLGLVPAADQLGGPKARDVIRRPVSQLLVTPAPGIALSSAPHSKPLPIVSMRFVGVLTAASHTCISPTAV